jgi:YD repeat-containing protein
MVIEGSIVKSRSGSPAANDSAVGTASTRYSRAVSAVPLGNRPATAEDLRRPLPKPPAKEQPSVAETASYDPAFVPANGVEENLLEAARQRRTDRFLSTLLLARVLVPGWDSDPRPAPDQWKTETLAGNEHFVTFTSKERMAERLGKDATASWIRFTTLIGSWPGDQLSFAVNPDTPVGATLPGDEIVALAAWAMKMGLDEDPESDAAPEPDSESQQPETQANEPLVMQKTISTRQVGLFLERGYDRASGFVHRAGEVDHLCTPSQIYSALGLGYSGSSFTPDASEVYLLRWRAYRGNLYRIPYGGPSEAARRATDGWVIERAPFRGNGFAPSGNGDVIAEFKVDSVRLPHGAQLWRLDRDGNERLVAILDADGPRWQLVGA